MRYMGAMFDPRKVAYDGGRLAPAVPKPAGFSPVLTEIVREAMVMAPEPGKGVASYTTPRPAGGGVAVAGATPSGEPIVMHRTSEPEEAPAPFVPPEVGGDVAPINDREASGPPMARERATFNVGATVDDSTLLAAGAALLVLLGVGVYVASRR